MTHYRLLSLVISLAILSASCVKPNIDQAKATQFSQPGASLSTNIPWVQADLRLLDPPDAQLPSQDIVAAYTRTIHKGKFAPFGKFIDIDVDQEIQVRLDFLDIAFQNQSDVYLAFDHQPGGVSQWPWGSDTQIAWDTLVLLPASGQIQAWDINQQNVNITSIRAFRNPVLDTLEIRLDASGLPGSNTGFKLQIMTTPAGEKKAADQLAPFHSKDYPPKPAQVLFAFWNTLPAYTPAQALRRWDGAHTGPLGGRHGLYNLLRTARSHKIPLALLDLKSPSSLSALDYVDGLQLVQKMAQEGLLILPETVPLLPDISPTALTPSADFLAQLTKMNRQISHDLGLSASQFIYSPLTPGLPAHYPVIFTNFPQPINAIDSPTGIISPLRWRDKVVIPIPKDLLAEQATLDGVSLETRRALALAATSPDVAMRKNRQTILVLGGDLPYSEWGDPQVARAGFRYLAAHPWIHILGTHDLLSARPLDNLSTLNTALPTNASGISIAEEAKISQTIEEISQLQPSPLSQTAWQALISLYGPLSPKPGELSRLRAIYANQLEILLAAAQWSIKPAPTSSCHLDLDLDGQMECVLASDEIFAVFNVEAGSLIYLFVKSSSGFHQVIAPSSQFAVGLSESSGWVLEKRLGADPSVIPGAFNEEAQKYQAMLDAPQLIFVNQEIIKLYRPIPGGMRIEYRASTPISTRLPIALDPWVRFGPSWGERYSWNGDPGGGVWRLSSGPSVQVRSNGQIEISHFAETRRMMSSTENPNAEYPPSHFLPFPLAVLDLQSPGDLFVEIFLSEQ